MTLILFSAPTFSSETSLDTASALPTQVKSKLKGTLKGKYAFKDKIGPHILILTRQAEVLPDETNKVSIQASQYLLVAGNWKQEWIINDNISCKDLDLEAEFLP